MESSKLYVGNLSYNTSEEELQTLFEEVGDVASCVIIKDRDTGRSRGFGFVEMADAPSAQAAIERFHGQEFESRSLTVNIARPREDRRGGGQGRPRRY